MKKNLTLRIKMALTEKVLETKFDSTDLRKTLLIADANLTTFISKVFEMSKEIEE